MTARRWVQLMCDGCGRNEKVGELTIALARAASKAAHWHHINPRRDICPDCWKEGKR